MEHTGVNEIGSSGRKRLVISFKDRNEDEKLISQLLTKANEKDFGDPVTAYDLVMMGVKSLNDKHIERLKEASINPRQRIEKAYREAVEKDNFNGTLDEFICSRAKI